MFRVSFNTGFINNKNLIKCQRENVSPEDLHKDFKTLPSNFSIQIYFDDYCKGYTDEESGKEYPPCRSHVT